MKTGGKRATRFGMNCPLWASKSVGKSMGNGGVFKRGVKAKDFMKYGFNSGRGPKAKQPPGRENVHNKQEDGDDLFAQKNLRGMPGKNEVAKAPKRPKKKGPHRQVWRSAYQNPRKSPTNQKGWGKRRPDRGRSAKRKRWKIMELFGTGALNFWGAHILKNSQGQPPSRPGD